MGLVIEVGKATTTKRGVIAGWRRRRRRTYYTIQMGTNYTNGFDKSYKNYARLT